MSNSNLYLYHVLGWRTILVFENDYPDAGLPRHTGAVTPQLETRIKIRISFTNFLIVAVFDVPVSHSMERETTILNFEYDRLHANVIERVYRVYVGCTADDIRPLILKFWQLQPTHESDSKLNENQVVIESYLS